MAGIIAWNTSHFWQISIFSCQVFWHSPWQKVPLRNQQKYRALYSQTMQLSLHSLGHFFISQHGLAVPSAALFKDKRTSVCRSIYVGICLSPCSKLCMVLGETHNNRANCLWLFPKYRRIWENCWRSIQKPLIFCVNLITDLTISQYGTSKNTTVKVVFPARKRIQ